MSAEDETSIHDASEIAEVSPPIIDCDVLEAAKENIQPIAKGRRATALSAILATPHAHRETRLATTRNRLRMNVQLALENSVGIDDHEDNQEEEDADPLEAYCTFVNWVVENYPQGHSAESGLLELLEEATRVLKDHQNGKWRNDIRYLKLWVLYASYVEKPTVVFKFCLVNEIGTEYALLYEEHALALERAGRKSEADETYLLGIARRVAPLERLKTKHQEFQKRMMSSPELPSMATPAPAAPDATRTATPQITPGTRRSVLGDSSAPSSGTRRVTRASSRLNAAESSSTPLIHTPPTRPQPNARVAIFVDTPIDASASPHVNNEDEPPSAWPDLGTRKSRIKENVKEATKAAGTTLKQSSRSRHTASSSTPKISVFRDPLPEDENKIAEGSTNIAPAPPPSVPEKSSKIKSARAIAVFCDDSSAVAPEPKKAKLSKGVSVYRDDASESPVVGSSSRPEKPPRAPTSKKGAIPVFCDDESGSSTQSKKQSSAKSKAKGPVAIFRDEDTQKSAVSPQTEQQSETHSPAFMPFIDEDMQSTAVAKEKAVGLGILGCGGAKGATVVVMSTEAEALRKDPLKNYPQDQKLTEID